MSLRTKALVAGVAITAGVSGYVFSQRSLSNLDEVRPELRAVTQCALDKSTVDFIVIDGWRSLEEHLVNVRNGRSWTTRSRHQDRAAIDFAAYADGKVTYDPAPYYAVAAAFYHCADRLDVPIVWGGEWKAKDLMHIELDRKVYP